MSIKLVETEEELKLAHKVRFTVFVEEQHTNPDAEVDDWDLTAKHWILYEDENVVGTVRLYIQSPETGIVGRMAIMKTCRKKGYGRMLMEIVETFAKANGVKQLKLHGQVRASEFYKACGYVQESDEVFVEEGIDHVHMIKSL